MLRGRAILVLLVVLALLVGAAGSATAAPTQTASTTVARDVPLEELLLAQINSLRTARGLGTWASSRALARAAVGHSRSMATNGFFAHESRNGAPFWQRVKRFYLPQTQSWTVGENLAMFGGAPPSAEAIVAAWLASPPHRANLLGRAFREAGVAIIHNPAAGGVFGGRPTWVITLDLGRR